MKSSKLLWTGNDIGGDTFCATMPTVQYGDFTLVFAKVTFDHLPQVVLLLAPSLTELTLEPVGSV